MSRKILMRSLLTVLTLGLITFLGSDKIRCVSVLIPCDEAWENYIRANDNYERARMSYFYGIPTTCQQECQGLPPSCINDCQIRRATALAQAQIELMNNALDTCTPYSIDECDRARGMAEWCRIQYNHTAYSNPDEALAVYVQYEACRLASKVDSCQ